MKHTRKLLTLLLALVMALGVMAISANADAIPGPVDWEATSLFLKNGNGDTYKAEAGTLYYNMATYAACSTTYVADMYAGDLDYYNHPLTFGERAEVFGTTRFTNYLQSLEFGTAYELALNGEDDGIPEGMVITLHPTADLKLTGKGDVILCGEAAGEVAPTLRLADFTGNVTVYGTFKGIELGLESDVTLEVKSGKTLTLKEGVVGAKSANHDNDVAKLTLKTSANVSGIFNKVTVTNGAKLTVEAGKMLVINGGKLMIKGDAHLNIKGDLAKYEASDAATPVVTGDALVPIEVDGEATLRTNAKGHQLIKLENNEKLTIKGDFIDNEIYTVLGTGNSELIVDAEASDVVYIGGSFKNVTVKSGKVYDNLIGWYHVMPEEATTPNDDANWHPLFAKNLGSELPEYDAFTALKPLKIDTQGNAFTVDGQNAKLFLTAPDEISTISSLATYTGAALAAREAALSEDSYKITTYGEAAYNAINVTNGATFTMGGYTLKVSGDTGDTGVNVSSGATVILEKNEMLISGGVNATGIKVSSEAKAYLPTGSITVNCNNGAKAVEVAGDANTQKVGYFYLGMEPGATEDSFSYTLMAADKNFPKMVVSGQNANAIYVNGYGAAYLYSGDVYAKGEGSHAVYVNQNALFVVNGGDWEYDVNDTADYLFGGQKAVNLYVDDADCGATIYVMAGAKFEIRGQNVTIYRVEPTEDNTGVQMVKDTKKDVLYVYNTNDTKDEYPLSGGTFVGTITVSYGTVADLLLYNTYFRDDAGFDGEDSRVNAAMSLASTMRETQLWNVFSRKKSDRVPTAAEKLAFYAKFSSDGTRGVALDTVTKKSLTGVFTVTNAELELRDVMAQYKSSDRTYFDQMLYLEAAGANEGVKLTGSIKMAKIGFHDDNEDGSDDDGYWQTCPFSLTAKLSDKEYALLEVMIGWYNKDQEMHKAVLEASGDAAIANAKAEMKANAKEWNKKYWSALEEIYADSMNDLMNVYDYQIPQGIVRGGVETDRFGTWWDVSDRITLDINARASGSPCQTLGHAGYVWGVDQVRGAVYVDGTDHNLYLGGRDIYMKSANFRHKTLTVAEGDKLPSASYNLVTYESEPKLADETVFYLGEEHKLVENVENNLYISRGMVDASALDDTARALYDTTQEWTDCNGYTNENALIYQYQSCLTISDVAALNPEHGMNPQNTAADVGAIIYNNYNKNNDTFNTSVIVNNGGHLLVLSGEVVNEVKSVHATAIYTTSPNQYEYKLPYRYDKDWVEGDANGRNYVYDKKFAGTVSDTALIGLSADAETLFRALLGSSETVRESIELVYNNGNSDIATMASITNNNRGSYYSNGNLSEYRALATFVAENYDLLCDLLEDEEDGVLDGELTDAMLDLLGEDPEEDPKPVTGAIVPDRLRVWTANKEVVEWRYVTGFTGASVVSIVDPSRDSNTATNLYINGAIVGWNGQDGEDAVYSSHYGVLFRGDSNEHTYLDSFAVFENCYIASDDADVYYTATTYEELLPYQNAAVKVEAGNAFVYGGYYVTGNSDVNGAIVTPARSEVNPDLHDFALWQNGGKDVYTWDDNAMSVNMLGHMYMGGDAAFGASFAVVGKVNFTDVGSDKCDTVVLNLYMDKDGHLYKEDEEGPTRANNFIGTVYGNTDALINVELGKSYEDYGDYSYSGRPYCEYNSETAGNTVIRGWIIADAKIHEGSTSQNYAGTNLYFYSGEAKSKVWITGKNAYGEIHGGLFCDDIFTSDKADVSFVEPDPFDYNKSYARVYKVDKLLNLIGCDDRTVDEMNYDWLSEYIELSGSKLHVGTDEFNNLSYWTWNHKDEVKPFDWSTLYSSEEEWKKADNMRACANPAFATVYGTLYVAGGETDIEYAWFEHPAKLDDGNVADNSTPAVVIGANYLFPWWYTDAFSWYEAPAATTPTGKSIKTGSRYCGMTAENLTRFFDATVNGDVVVLGVDYGSPDVAFKAGNYYAVKGSNAPYVYVQQGVYDGQFAVYGDLTDLPNDDVHSTQVQLHGGFYKFLRVWDDTNNDKLVDLFTTTVDGYAFDGNIYANNSKIVNHYVTWNDKYTSLPYGDEFTPGEGNNVVLRAWYDEPAEYVVGAGYIQVHDAVYELNRITDRGIYNGVACDEDLDSWKLNCDIVLDEALDGVCDVFGCGNCDEAAVNESPYWFDYYYDYASSETRYGQTITVSDRDFTLDMGGFDIVGAGYAKYDEYDEADYEDYVGGEIFKVDKVSLTIKNTNPNGGRILNATAQDTMTKSGREYNPAMQVVDFTPMDVYIYWKDGVTPAKNITGKVAFLSYIDAESENDDDDAEFVPIVGAYYRDLNTGFYWQCVGVDGDYFYDFSIRSVFKMPYAISDTAAGYDASRDDDYVHELLAPVGNVDYGWNKYSAGVEEGAEVNGPYSLANNYAKDYVVPQNVIGLGELYYDLGAEKWMITNAEDYQGEVSIAKMPAYAITVDEGVLTLEDNVLVRGVKGGVGAYSSEVSVLDNASVTSTWTMRDDGDVSKYTSYADYPTAVDHNSWFVCDAANESFVIVEDAINHDGVAIKSVGTEILVDTTGKVAGVYYGILSEGGSIDVENGRISAGRSADCMEDFRGDAHVPALSLIQIESLITHFAGDGRTVRFGSGWEPTAIKAEYAKIEINDNGVGSFVTVDAPAYGIVAGSATTLEINGDDQRTNILGRVAILAYSDREGYETTVDITGGHIEGYEGGYIDYFDEDFVDDMKPYEYPGYEMYVKHDYIFPAADVAQARGLWICDGAVVENISGGTFKGTIALYQEGGTLKPASITGGTFYTSTAAMDSTLLGEYIYDDASAYHINEHGTVNDPRTTSGAGYYLESGIARGALAVADGNTDGAVFTRIYLNTKIPRYANELPTDPELQGAGPVVMSDVNCVADLLYSEFNNSKSDGWLTVNGLDAHRDLTFRDNHAGTPYELGESAISDYAKAYQPRRNTLPTDLDLQDHADEIRVARLDSRVLLTDNDEPALGTLYRDVNGQLSLADGNVTATEAFTVTKRTYFHVAPAFDVEGFANPNSAFTFFADGKDVCYIPFATANNAAEHMVYGSNGLKTSSDAEYRALHAVAPGYVYVAAGEDVDADFYVSLDKDNLTARVVYFNAQDELSGTVYNYTSQNLDDANRVGIWENQHSIICELASVLEGGLTADMTLLVEDAEPATWTVNVTGDGTVYWQPVAYVTDDDQTTATVFPYTLGNPEPIALKPGVNTITVAADATNVYTGRNEIALWAVPGNGQALYRVKDNDNVSINPGLFEEKEDGSYALKKGRSETDQKTVVVPGLRWSVWFEHFDQTPDDTIFRITFTNEYTEMSLIEKVAAAIDVDDATDSAEFSRVALRDEDVEFSVVASTQAQAYDVRTLTYTVEAEDENVDVADYITLSDETVYSDVPVTVTVDKTTPAGTYTITATTVASTTGEDDESVAWQTATYTIEVKKVDIADAEFTTSLDEEYDVADHLIIYDNYEYDFEVVTMTVNDIELTTEEYKVSGDVTAKNVGEYTVVFTAVGPDYCGTTTYEWSIVESADMFKTEDADDKVYSGIAYTVDDLTGIVVEGLDHAGEQIVTLTKGVDYELVYEPEQNDGVAEMKNAGTYTVTVKGINNYKDQADGYVFFTILPKHLTDGIVAHYSNNTGFVYSGSEKTITVLVEDAIESQIVTLVEDVDYELVYENNVNATTDDVKATLTVKGIGNYDASLESVTFEIAPMPITDDMFTVDDTNVAYLGFGVPVTPDVFGNDGANDLTAGTDFTVEYQNNYLVGTASAIITAKGNYTGTATVDFVIKPKAMVSADMITLTNDTGLVYDGNPKTVTVAVDDAGFTTLVEGTDYVVEYENNTNAGTATVKVTGKGNYGGTISKTFNIAPKSLEGAVLTFAQSTFTYNGEEQTAVVTGVKLGDVELTADVDYTVDAETLVATEANVYTAKVDGCGNYTGTATGAWSISTANFAVDEIAALTYNGAEQSVTAIVKDLTGTALTEGVDYTVTGTTTAKNADTYTLTVTGMGNFAGEISKTWTIGKVALTASATASGKTYDGNKTAAFSNATLTGVIGSDDVTLDTTAAAATFATANAGDNIAVTFSGFALTGADKDNYTLSQPAATTANIAKAVLTVKADNKEMTVGAARPTLTYVITGFVNGETTAVVTGAPALNTTSNAVGTYPITVAQGTLAAANYSFTFVNGTMTVKASGTGGGTTGGGGVIIPTTTNYTVTCGTGVTASVKEAKANATVTLTVADGYEKPVVTTEAGAAVTVTASGTKFTFKMPAANVKVSVSAKVVAPSACLKDSTCVMNGYADLDKTLWYHDGVHFCLENGLMNGVSTTAKLFDPMGTTTRGTVVTMLARMDGVTITSSGAEWYVDGMNWAIANGVSDGSAMGDNITREQIVTMLYRYATKKGYDVKKTTSLNFSDASDVSSYAVDAMKWGVASGLINGRSDDGVNIVLAPQGTATRAEIATIFMNFCTKVAK